MDVKRKAEICVEILKEEYPDPACSLRYSDPLQMLIAVRLSAQCADKRVNLVTPALFERFPDVYSFSRADPDEVGKYIASCGLYKVKSKDIVETCKKLIKDFGGVVPDDMGSLTSLPGVGRKTANLILGDVYGKPAVVVDTHFMRITRRLGFHDSKSPEKVEKIMRELLPPEESNNFCHRTVLHGRAVCKALRPKCEKCRLKELCDCFKNTEAPVRT